MTLMAMTEAVVHDHPKAHLTTDEVATRLSFRGVKASPAAVQRTLAALARRRAVLRVQHFWRAGPTGVAKLLLEVMEEHPHAVWSTAAINRHASMAGDTSTRFERRGAYAFLHNTGIILDMGAGFWKLAEAPT